MLIATCDDEIKYCNQVEEFSKKLAQTLGIEVQCDKYESGTELLKKDIRQYKIIFLDIDMKDENGIHIAEKIREIDKKVEIIFLTALIQYAIEGYRVNAYRFLVKPMEYNDFEFQLAELFVRINRFEKSNLKLTREGQDYTIKIDDIMYIEVMNHSLTYHCVNYDITVSGTMKKIENSLTGHYFARIHNSYMVNMRYIAEVKSQEIIMKNGTSLSVARSKKDTFRQAYLNFWGDELG